MKLLHARSAAFAVAMAFLLLGATFAFAQESGPVSDSVETNAPMQETTEVQVVTEEDLVIEEEPITEAETVPATEPTPEPEVAGEQAEEPSVEDSTPAEEGTPKPLIFTDKPDYAPTDEATIFGKYFAPVYTFLLKIVGGFEDGSENVTFTDTVTTDDTGSFIYKYLLDGIYRPFYTAKALVIDAGDVIASVDFTDSKPTSVSLSPVTNAVTAGGSATYSVSVSMDANANNCTVTLSVTSALPAGVTATFAGSNPVTGNANFSRNLTLATTNAIPVGSHTFTVQAVGTTPGCNGSASSNTFTINGTLVVTSAAPVTASISGTKFKDLDADGEPKEAGEPNISGWTMRLYDTATNPWTLVDTKVTDGSGAYTFASVPVGSYKVCEVLQSGWIQTFASVQGSNTSPNASAEGQWCVTRNVTSSTNPAAANFGNFEKVNLTITASSHTIVYGAAVPTITPSYSGLITGDTAPDTLPTCAHTASPSPNAGGYTTSCSGAADPKYNITYVPGTLTINKAEPLCTISGYNGVYDGNAHGATGSCKGVSNETLSGLSLGASLTNVPGGTASWSFIDTTGNYNNTSGTAAIVINKAASVTAVTCPTAVEYSGAAQTPCTASVTGAGGLMLTTNPAYANNINVGTINALYTYPGDDNHEGSTDSETFEITKAASVTTVTCTTGPFVYSGSAQTLCTVSVTGAGGLTLTPTPTYTNNTNAGTASASYSYDGDSNHTGSTDSETFTIGKAESSTTVTFEAGPYTYRGTAFMASAQVTGVGGLDQAVAIVHSGECTNVTTTDGCTATATFTGDDNHNGSSDVKSITITKAASVTLVTCSPELLVYTGEAQTPCTVSVTGAGGLNLTETPNYSDNTDAGTASAVYVFDGDTNHEGSEDTTTFGITQAASVTTVTCPASVVYNGMAQTPCSASVTGAGGLNFAPVPSYTNNTNAGSASASYTYAGNANHTGSSDSENFAITKADPGCDISGYTGIYDGVAHGASGSCIGVKAEALTGLNLGASFTNFPGGTANWSFTDETGNYNSANGSTAIVINKADVSCSVTGYTVTYDGIAHIATGDCKGVLNETLTGPDLTGTTHTDAGEYNDTWNFTDVTGNYNNISGNVTDKINKAALTLTAQPANKQYSDPLPPLTGAYTGFVTGETTAVLTGTLACTTTATQFSSAGAYPINCSGQTAANYTINPVAGTLTVTQENTAIAYTGASFALTSGSSVTAANISLSALLSQEADGNLGAIELAKVTFTLTPQGGGSPIIVSNVSVDSSGIAAVSQLVQVAVYDVKVTLTGGTDYWVAATIGAGTLAVGLGGTEQRVTGGGWIKDLESLNDKDNYGFTVNFNKNGAPKGNFLFMFRGEDGYDYKIKNNSWSQGGLSFLSTTKAYFSGRATLSKIDQQTGLVVFSDGSYTFGVTITDGGTGKAAAPDTFAITVFNSTGGVWKQLGPLAPGGGNIVIHNK